MRDQDFITVYDVSLLLSRGFSFGISENFLWCTDVDGERWQAVAEDEYFMFGKRDNTRSGIIMSRSTMTREKFDSLFK